MAAPTPNATYNRVGTSLLFNTSYSVASGKALFVVANTVFIKPSTPTGWTLARTGSNFKLFTRTANGTSTDNFGNAFYGTGLVFDSGVTEDYTSGTWDNTSSVAPAPNGGSALSSSTDELVIVALNYARTLWVDGYQGATDSTPATTSGFTAGTSVGASNGNGPFNYFGIVDIWDWDDFAVQVQYKALTTSTPGTTTWGAYYSGADNIGIGSDAWGGQTYPGDTFYSATLAFKAASSGTAYTASATSTITASGTASLTKSLTGSATGTVTATGTGAITYTANSTASSSITANGTAAGTKTVSIGATSTITATGTAAMSSTLVIGGSGTGTATGSASASTTSPVSITATSSITATGTSAAKSTQPLAGSGTVTASGLADLTLRPLQTATASSSVTASGTAASTLTYSATASSSITATGIAVLSQSLKASASSTITGTATGAVGTLATASTVTAVASSPSVARINPNETRVSRA